MDPITLEIASAIGKGLATSAGERVGTALATLADRVRKRLPGSQRTVEETAAALDAEFARDPAFAEEIRSLWGQVNHGNSFVGIARNVVQIEENNATINFH